MCGDYINFLFKPTPLKYLRQRKFLGAPNELAYLSKAMAFAAMPYLLSSELIVSFRVAFLTYFYMCELVCLILLLWNAVHHSFIY